MKVLKQKVSQETGRIGERKQKPRNEEMERKGKKKIAIRKKKKKSCVTKFEAMSLIFFKVIKLNTCFLSKRSLLFLIMLRRVTE